MYALLKEIFFPLFLDSVDDDFPIITLHFEGADMKLKGSHYLIQQQESVRLIFMTHLTEHTTLT